MPTTLILESSAQFVREFQRCCKSYHSLDIAVAWCGNPKNRLPYQLLAHFGPRLTAVAGVSFHQTHPDGIKWLLDHNADIRIFKPEGPTFHPKIYFFRNQDGYALFVGSSNLTYSGFYTNHETNCLIEGKLTGQMPDNVTTIQSAMEKWRTSEWSFSPTQPWLRGYRIRHRRAIERQKKQKIATHPLSDDNVPPASWVQVANWEVYYENVVSGINRLGGGTDHHNILDLAAQRLQPPWNQGHFDNDENRRLIGGYPPYGWFGHVGAAGKFRHILKNGSDYEQSTIVQNMNAIANLQTPVPYNQLAQHLNALVQLGLTIKVWSRLLCIVRPAIYCTVASPSVRKNLSAALRVPRKRFETVDGYVALLRWIHASPWYNATEPVDQAEVSIWRRRAAFLDAIFYKE